MTSQEIVTNSFEKDSFCFLIKNAEEYRKHTVQPMHRKDAFPLLERHVVGIDPGSSFVQHLSA